VFIYLDINKFNILNFGGAKQLKKPNFQTHSVLKLYALHHLSNKNNG